MQFIDFKAEQQHENENENLIYLKRKIVFDLLLVCFFL